MLPAEDLFVYATAQAARATAVLLPPAKGQRHRMPPVLRGAWPSSRPNGDLAACVGRRAGPAGAPITSSLVPRKGEEAPGRSGVACSRTGRHP